MSALRRALGRRAWPALLALLGLGLASATPASRGAPTVRRAPQERQELAPVAVDPCPPGPPRGLGGLGGVSTVSALRFAGAPDAVHRFETVYVHPDRARWRRLTPDERARSMSFRFGARVWELPEQQDLASELGGAERDARLLELELRRATLLWPLGFDWTELPAGAEGGGLRAGVSARRIAAVPRCDGRPQEAIGQLVAELDADGRPLRVRALDAEERERASLAVSGWVEREGRRWPAELAFARGGEEVWSEAIEETRSRLFLVDNYFLPPHLQPRSTLDAGAMEVPLFTITFRAHPIPASDGWPEAVERCRQWIAAAGEELGEGPLTVDPVPCIELTEEGRPARALVRLKPAPAETPEGWTSRPAGRGMAAFLDGVAALGPGAIQSLQARVPAGLAAGVPYCRLVADGGPRSVQLYLPYAESTPPEDGQRDG